ncbi:MAG: hypothetical protein ACOYYU_04960 [Chloroflexota bacterium]
MKKSKYFVFVVAILSVFLLVTGNWVTSAQANNANFIASTPTVIPVTTPSDQDEPVPETQQETLKAVIQSYFEIRYNSLSTSQPYGFQLDGFSELVSDKTDARVFLEAELGKLRLERKYAELNHSRYVDYKYSLDFSTVTVDTGKATET